MHGSCHCGAVRIEVARPPEWVGECNCSICRRTGALFAYYPPGDVMVTGKSVSYIWGDRCLALHHCPTCGNTTHWENLMPDPQRMGVNARLLDGFWNMDVERRAIDGASF
jgi:hypothetical protein